MRQSVTDMVWSMGLVLAVIAVILLITLRPQPDAVKVVDPAQVLIAARTLAPFPVLVPKGLDGYQVTSARWQETSKSGGALVLHLGYVTPENQYVQVSQSIADSGGFIAEQTAAGVAAEQVRIDAAAWQLYEATDRISLVLLGAEATTVVSGTVTQEELEQVARSLTAN